jgi:DNA-binding Lrp family transcriptional regulator
MARTLPGNRKQRVAVIAAELGRTPDAVCVRLTKLRHRPIAERAPRSYVDWTDAEDAVVLTVRPMREAAALCGRTEWACRSRLRVLRGTQ